MSQRAAQTQPVISEAAFSGLFGRITDQLDPYTEGARVGVLVSLMAAFSAYIGYGPTVETGKGESPLAFWPVLVGPSGLGRKGTATGIAMRVIQSAFKSFHEDNTVYGLPATGLGFITELDERAFGGTANPVLFVEEEMDTFIQAARRDSKVGVYLRKSWDGMTIAHKTKQDDIKVKRPHLGVIGHCQPKNWAAIRGSKDATGGTYNRFMPVFVYQSKTLPVFQAVDSADAIRECARALRSAGDFAREVDTVSVPQHVAEVFESKHRPIIEALTNSSEELSQYCERAMAYMVRLAALYALSDKREEVSVRDFDAALALVTYSVETVSFILPEAEINDETSMAVKVESFIRDAGEDGVNGSEIYRHFAIKASELREIVAELETVEVTTVKGGRGRPAMIYRYVGKPEASEVTSEEIEEINEVETPAPVEIPSVDVMADADFWSEESDMDFWGETPEEAAVKAELIEASADVPSAVRDLRAILDAAEKGNGPEVVTIPEESPKASQAPIGVSGLAALLESLSAPESAPEVPVMEEAPVTLTIVPEAVKAGRAGSKVIPVPPVVFMSPSVEYGSAA